MWLDDGGGKIGVSEDLDHELAALLGEDHDAARERRVTALDEMVGPLGTKPVVLFGAGSLGVKTLNGLRGLGIEPVAFLDNDRTKIGQRVDQLEVVPVDELARRFGSDAAVVVTIFSPGHRYADTAARLKSLGFNAVAPFAALAWKYPHAFLPHMRIDLPEDLLQHAQEVMGSFQLFEDDRSRQLFLAHVRWRLHLDFEGLPSPDSDPYFPADLVRLGRGDIVLDCGAFDGDTLRYALDQFGPAFERWVAYEPDPASFQRLQGYVRGLPSDVASKIQLRPCAVGSDRGHVLFEATGTMNSAVSVSGAVKVEEIALDEDQPGTEVSFLKLDIEGAELAALKGADRLIHRRIPTIALELTHRLADLWTIPRYLSSLDLGYRYALRSYEGDGCDLVLYALPQRSA